MIMKKPICAATCLFLATFVVHAADQPMANTTPDNTEINKRDRHEQALTPLDQSNQGRPEDYSGNTQVHYGK